MKARLAKLVTAAVAALAVAAVLAGSAAAYTIDRYCARGYTLAGSTSSYFKAASDVNKDGYVCVKVVNKRSYTLTDDFTQLIL